MGDSTDSQDLRFDRDDPRSPETAVEYQTGYGPRDHQRGNQAHSVCPNCGDTVAIPHSLEVDGEHQTVCECASCGSLAL